MTTKIVVITKNIINYQWDLDIYIYSYLIYSYLIYRYLKICFKSCVLLLGE